jgi:hypothetical protein
MNVSAAEIERIVRDVLNLLVAAETSLGDSVISMSTLRGISKENKSVRIASNAIVTPAARDWCRDQGIALVRGERSSAVASDRPQAGATSGKLFIAGMVPWMSSLAKQLCPKQTSVADPLSDDASVIRSVANAVRHGHSTCLAIVASPHSALWQAARDDALRPAIVSQWSDLADVLREVPANVLIVPAKRWSLAGVANIARKLLEHTHART